MILNESWWKQKILLEVKKRIPRAEQRVWRWHRKLDRFDSGRSSRAWRVAIYEFHNYETYKLLAYWYGYEACLKWLHKVDIIMIVFVTRWWTLLTKQRLLNGKSHCTLRSRFEIKQKKVIINGRTPFSRSQKSKYLAKFRGAATNISRRPGSRPITVSLGIL